MGTKLVVIRSGEQGHATDSALLEALGATAEALARHDNPETAIGASLSPALEVAGLDRAVLFLCDDRGDPAPFLDVGFGDDPVAAALERHPLVAQVIAKRRPLTLPGPDVAESAAAELLRLVGAASAVIAPLAGRDRPQGALLLLSSRPGPAAPSLGSFAQALAGQLAQAVQLGRALRTRRDSEERYRALMGSAADAVMIADQDGRVLEVNRQYVQLTGVQPGEVVGSHLLERVHRRWQERAAAAVAEVVAHGSARIDGLVVFGGGGRKMTVDASASMVDVVGARQLIVVLRDAAPRLAAERALELRARRQEAVARLGRLALQGAELGQLAEAAVREAETLLGVDACGLLELEPDARALVMRACVGWGAAAAGSMRLPVDERSIAGAVALSGEPILVDDLTGDQRWSESQRLCRLFGYRSCVAVVVDGRSAPVGVLGAHSKQPGRFNREDVDFLQSLANVIGEATARRRSEEARATQAAVVEQVFASMADCVAVCDREGRFLLWNRATEGLMVRPLAAHVPLSRWASHHGFYRPDGKELFPEAELPMVRALAGIPSDGVEILYRPYEQGESVLLSVSARPLYGPDGAIFGALSVFRDTTLEHAAVAALRRTKEDFRRILDASPEGICILRGTRMVHANPAWDRMRASPGGAWRSVDIMEMIAPEHRDALAGALAATERGEVVAPLELRCLRDDDDDALLEVSVTYLSEFEGAPAVLLVAADRTEAKRLQGQLLISDRLASIGSLAAGVAHEINNPLAAIIANLELATRALAAPVEASELESVCEGLRDARDAAEQVRHIVRDLKLFSRAPDEQRGPVDPRRVLDSTLRIAWNEIKHRARLVKDLEVVPPVLANEARLGQVFLNLLVNAAQAIPDGQPADRHVIRVRTGVAEDGRVQIEISDTGVGMSAEVQRRLFTPFFTTKASGTGLGLPICQGIIKGLGGEILVASAPGRGTTMRVLLPGATGEAIAGPRAATVTLPPPLRRATVLIVDDDPLVGATARRVLARDHQVEFTVDAPQALEWIRAGKRWDVILCDIMMPEMSGMELHREITACAPELAARMVFMTGGAFTPAARQFLDEIPNPRLEKPFDVAALRTFVAERVGKER